MNCDRQWPGDASRDYYHVASTTPTPLTSPLDDVIATTRQSFAADDHVNYHENGDWLKRETLERELLKIGNEESEDDLKVEMDAH